MNEGYAFRYIRTTNVFTYDILFLFCMLHTEGRDSIRLASGNGVYAMQRNTERFIWGGEGGEGGLTTDSR